jgi:uncharacterized protein YjbI with pentapeptide repeats
MPTQTENNRLSCKQEGCNGIRLPAVPMCLAHCSEEERTAALKQISDTGVIDVRGVTVTDALFQQILAAAPHDADGKVLIKGWFDRATFEGGARFDRATFSGNAQFHGTIFGGDAQFGEATFCEDAMFADATFGGHSGFDGATFCKGAMFAEATFRADAVFAGAAFHNGGAVFSGATFRADAWFRQATFDRDAVFDWATFSGNAQFDRATFSGNARFRKAIFEGGAVFGKATFKGAVFGEATFRGNAEFDGATFRGNAEFDRATFMRRAGFAGARFLRAGFAGATFELSRQFGHILACRELVLDNVRFAQPVQIEVSSPRLSCRRSRFPGGVQFRLRWACVVLDDTDLAAPSILAGIPHLSSEELARQERHIASSWKQDLAGEFPERPQLLSLRRTNVAGLGLSNVSAADCRFVGAHNLDKLRLESDVTFETAPLPLGLGARKWGGREVIAEERTWRAPRYRHWPAPRWPRRQDIGDEPGVLDPRQIAGLYRALRKGREDIKDEPGAADFYYGEMEMRRRPPNADNADGQPRTTSRGRVERGILAAYWLVSGYGLRAWRAVACLAVVTAILAVLFHLFGFTVPPRPVSYWTSLLYAFRATLSLTDNDVKLTAWGQLLQGVLRLTGPVLLGLALLALRGRVKR